MYLLHRLYTQCELITELRGLWTLETCWISTWFCNCPRAKFGVRVLSRNIDRYLPTRTGVSIFVLPVICMNLMRILKVIIQFLSINELRCIVCWCCFEIHCCVFEKTGLFISKQLSCHSLKNENVFFEYTQLKWSLIHVHFCNSVESNKVNDFN